MIPTTVIFRANDNTNSSGDAFKGNWIGAGVNEISFYARHDESVAMTPWLRIAPNGPAWNIRASSDVPVGDGWQLITFPISLADVQAGYGTSWIYSTATPNPLDAPAQYAAAFSAVVNLQISFEQEGQAAASTTFFELDEVSVVPEPTSAAVLAGAGALGLLKRRRRQARITKAAVAVASVAGVTSIAMESASAMNPAYFNTTVPQFENPTWWAGSPDPIPALATAQQWDTFLDGLGNATLSGPGAGVNNFLFNDAVVPPAVAAPGSNNSIYIFSQADVGVTIPTDTVALSPGGGTLVNVQIAATIGVDGTGVSTPITTADFAILPNSLHITDPLGNTLAGGAAGDVTNYEVTASYQGSFAFFPGFPVKGEHYLYQFFLPNFSGDFKIAWTERNHSVFDALRVDTLTVVPEPATAGTLALVSCGALVTRRRRRSI